MDLGIKGKRALVTGASMGIGREVALTLAREGADVAICARGADTLNATVAEIKALGVKGVGIRCDCAVPEQVQSMVERTVKELGGIDILVNSVGEAAAGDFLGITEDQWQESIEGKFMGQIRVTKAVIPHMKQSRWGRIIHVVGTSGSQPGPANLPPGATNAALTNFIKGLGQDLVKRGILINGVSPGFIETRRADYVIQRQAETSGVSADEAKADLIQAIPIKRIGTTNEIADVVVFLASERASYVTGELVIVDGGLTRCI